MAGPLSGIGAGQQVPLNQTIQPNQNNSGAIRGQDERENQQQANQVQPQGAPAAETQESSEDLIRQQLAEFASGERSEIDNQNERASGSIIDTLV